jgi:uncharacterized membrane protein YdjX (TVP38/TMEM64 family)
MLGVGLTVAGAVWVVHANAGRIHAFIDTHTVAGVIVYLALDIADALVVPGATLPLIPVVARTWGRIPAALATMAGWTAGSLLAFLIARRWGAPVVRKLAPMERVKRLRNCIPKNLFWSIVLLRTFLPMDVISYVLGLFSDMSWPAYATATALGLAPSAFLLVYLGRTPHAFSIIAVIVTAGVVGSLIYSARRQQTTPTDQSRHGT